MIERDKVVGGTKTYNLHYTASGTNRIAEVADVNGNALRTLTYRTGGDLYQDQVVGGDLLTYSPNVLKRPVVVQRTERTWYPVIFVEPSPGAVEATSPAICAK